MCPHHTEEQIWDLILGYCSGSWGSPQWLWPVPSHLGTKCPFMSTSLNKVYGGSSSIQRKFQVSRTPKYNSGWSTFKVSQVPSPLHSVLRQRSFFFPLQLIPILLTLPLHCLFPNPAFSPWEQKLSLSDHEYKYCDSHLGLEQVWGFNFYFCVDW